MCKNHFISVLAALVLCAASECVAQTENPRGVYKLMTITGYCIQLHGAGTENTR